MLEADRVNFQFNGYYSLILTPQWLRIQTSDGRKTLGAQASANPIEKEREAVQA
ncbi:MAG: hypothetical protein HPY84_07395 [Syntrophobacteraceae bacterium]|nr:hypothetical protein [Syntrophobacteraceae bacterium]